MEEIWKSVPSKPGLLASNLGRIKLPDSEAKMPNGVFRKYTPKPMFGFKTKASKKARHEYFGHFSKKFGNIKIHRVVCEAFHGAPPTARSVVIHKDENALNNRSDNLKWGTQKENLNMPGFIAYCKSRTGANNPHLKGLAKRKLITA